jgi:hypothetical protein
MERNYVRRKSEVNVKGWRNATNIMTNFNSDPSEVLFKI